MNYVKIDANNKVEQVQPYEGDGFVKVHESIIAGMYHDGSDSFAKSTFSVVPSQKTWDDVREKQRDMIVMYQDIMEIHEREVAHANTDEANYTISVAQYQEMLDYFQVVRSHDDAQHSAPQDAINALDGLSLPSFLTAG